MDLRKKPTTWKGLQNTEDTTEGDVEDILDGTEWWCGDVHGGDTIYLYSGDKHKIVMNCQWLVVSSKGKVRVMYSSEFYDEFEEKL